LRHFGLEDVLGDGLAGAGGPGAAAAGTDGCKGRLRGVDTADDDT